MAVPLKTQLSQRWKDDDVEMSTAEPLFWLSHVYARFGILNFSYQNEEGG